METVSCSSTATTERFSFAIQTGAEQMLGELLGNRLEVILIPQKIRTNENGMIRVAASKNPRWYREFCLKYLKPLRRRKVLPDTNIKRLPTIRALMHIIHNTEPKFETYVLRLIPEIEIYARKNKISLGNANPF